MNFRAGMVLALVFVLSGFLEAHAQRRLEITASSQPEYGRLILRWSDGEEAPEVTAQSRGGIVVLRFEELVVLDLEALPENLPEWIAFARMDSDQRGVRLALRAPAKTYSSSSPPLTAVDMVLRDSEFRPPAIISERQRRLEGESQEARVVVPEAVSYADLEVGLSSMGGRHLLVFRWSMEVEYEAEGQADGGLVLKFSAQADPDLSRLKLEKPEALSFFEAFNTIDGFRVRLVPESPYTMTHYREDGVIHAVLALPPSLEELSGAEVQRAVPEQVLAPAALLPPEQENQTWLRGDWPDPVPASGQVKVDIFPLDGGMKLDLFWDKPVPAAIFMRNSSIWAVFGAEARLVIDTKRLPAGFLVRQVEAQGASVLHIEIPAGMQPEADARGGQWHISVRPIAVQSAQGVKLIRRVSDTGRVSLSALLSAAAGIVWFRDAVIGDQIAAVLAFGSGRGVRAGRRLLEAEILPSAHGVAVVPRSDRLSVRLAGERLSIGTDSGLMVTDTGAQEVFSAGGSDPGFIDFEEWGRESGSEWLERRYELERRVALAVPKSIASLEACLDLVRFYVGHDMGHEALGMLEMGFSMHPLVSRDGRFLVLRGIASIQAGRYGMAEEWLSKNILRGEKSSTIWRALAAARRGEWEKSYQMFLTAEEQIPRYVPEWASVFHAAAAEAALKMEDWDLAERHARQASLFGIREPLELAALVRAEIVARTEGAEQSFALLSDVAEMASDPIGVRAELRRLELGSELGQISTGDVVEGLESLRYRWRGDMLELQIIAALSRQYMEIGHFREALSLAKVASVQNPDMPGARELRQQSSVHFRRLFLEAGADRLDPIEALALFYEFKELTPIGPDGDRMIRKLSGRLVRFDLLEQASELLQHQVDSRIRGSGRARIAVDLASVYLLDRKPDRALKALRSTRNAGMPVELMRERRLLEATALIHMGRHDHAVELIEDVEGSDAAMLRAEAYWRQADWPQAAKALSVWLELEAEMEPQSHVMMVMQAAIAARMAGYVDMLEQLREKHMSGLKKTEQAGSFDLITARTDTGGAALAEAVRRMSDLSRVDAFAASLKTRLSDSGKLPDKP